MYLKKPAFTMIELIFVILILGILASLAMPRIDRDLRQEAVANILSGLRYTQHLALTDNVRSNNAAWQRSFWRFGFIGCSDNGIFYYIASDKDLGGGNVPSINEAALDPSNGNLFSGLNTQPCATNISGQTNASSNIFITKRHSINGRVWAGGCGGGYIGFDHLGRPHSGFLGSVVPNYASVMTTDCNLTLTFASGDIAPLVITIEKETGHVFVVGQEEL